MTPKATAIDDTGTGSIKRSLLRRVPANIRPARPSAATAPQPARARADEIRARKDEVRHEREHREVVEAEIAALDAHVKSIEERLARLEARPGIVVGPGAGRGLFEAQELRAERRQCRELRAMLEVDLRAGPIKRHPDGRPVDDCMRAIVHRRTRELAESQWYAAGRDAAAGDLREARRNRVDAIRSRHIAEYEIGLRPFLPGYSQPWS